MYLESSFRGMWLGRITLDPVSGSIVAGELERIEQELFEADWAEARTLLGREPNSTDLARSGGQRRADALVEMATRSRTAPEDGRRPAPLFSVLVDYDTIHGRICELADGTAVSPGSLPPWFDGAYLERVVFGPDDASRSAVPHGCSREPPGGRSSSGIGNAPIPTATCPPHRAKSTTWSRLPSVGPRLRRTVGCSAASTIALETGGRRPDD